MIEVEFEPNATAERRRELIEELTPIIHQRYPLISWKVHTELVVAAVDAKLLYERYGKEP